MKFLCILFIISLSACAFAGDGIHPPLPDAVRTRPSHFVDLKSDIPELRIDLIYAGPKNICRRRLYPTGCRAWADNRLADALRLAVNDLSELGYGITIYDAYRPLSVTVSLWNKALKLKTGEDSYAAPWLGSDHNRGAAIDIGLFDLKTKKPLPMPCPVDGFGEKSADPKATYHAELLTTTLTKHGFEGHPNEWWHFSFPPARDNPAGNWKP